jgi:hypothetical protein
LTKEIEENARWKEETKERFDSEQKELKTQKRELRLSKIGAILLRDEFSQMSDESFEMFFSGIEKDYNDKIEAKKKAEEDRIAKEKADAEAHEKMRIENERLKADAAEKEKQIEAERAKADAERKKIEEANRKLKAEQEAALIAAAKEKAEKDKLEAELKAKADAEEKARKDAEQKLIAERKAKAVEEKKAQNAPDKIKLIELAAKLNAFELPGVKSEEAQLILNNVKSLLAKTSLYIREQSNNL